MTWLSQNKDKTAQAVSWEGTDILRMPGNTGANGGTWKAFIVYEAAVISAITDDGEDPSSIPTGETIPAGAFVGANGHFTSITLTSGKVAMSRVQQ